MQMSGIIKIEHRCNVEQPRNNLELSYRMNQTSKIENINFTAMYMTEVVY